MRESLKVSYSFEQNKMQDFKNFFGKYMTVFVKAIFNVCFCHQVLNLKKTVSSVSVWTITKLL